MRQSSALRSGSKLRSLLTRVLRRCGIDRTQHARRHGRARRRSFEGMQALEPRQLLSVAIEMAIHQDVNTPVYVQNASTVNVSLGDSITVDLFVTISEDEATNTTLSGYTLNFAGTNVSISLDEWLRNTILFPASSGDVFLFSEDAVDDGIVSAGIIGAGPHAITPGVGNGLFLGSLDITLPNTAGDYVLTLTTSQSADNPTDITHTLEPAITISTPTINSLTFHTVEAATVDIATLPTLTNDVAGNFSSINIVTANVDPAEFDIHDLKLELAGGLTISGAGWDSYGDVSLTETNTDGTYQLVGLDDIIGLADGDYTLTVLSAGVFNTAGIPLLVDDVVSFTVDTAAPAVSVNDLTTSDATPTLTGTVTDLTLSTMSITVTHGDDLGFASQTFNYSNDGNTANDDFTIDANGNWTLDGSKFTALEGGTYDVHIVAADELAQTRDEVYQDKLTITDTYEPDDSDATAVLLTNTRQYDLSLHEVGDVDWKSFDYAGVDNLLVVANVVSGAELTVNLYLYDAINHSLPETPTQTVTSTNGSLEALFTPAQLTAGLYYIEITSPGNMVYNYSFAAGNETDLSNSIAGTVFVDDNFDGVSNDGLGGWQSMTVQLLDTSDNLITSTTTAADGTYSFTNVISDTYRVRIVLPDGTFQTTSNPADFLLDGAVDQTGVDFGVRDVEVAGEYIFYNQSIFDGNNIAANSSDDAAIDDSKTALLPGATASIANYSSGNEGINGIMIDVIGLQVSSLTTADFIFKVGNDSTPDDWTNAPAPTSITVRPGEGVNGSDRVTIIWADVAIANQWLQVTVLADGTANVAADHVFYFGNCIGDTSGDGFTNIVDVFQVWNNRKEQGIDPPVAPNYKYDINHDSFVNISDVFLTWNNRKEQGIAQGLALITPPAVAPLMLAGSVTAVSDQLLVQNDLLVIQAQAIAYWQQQGINTSQLDLLTSTQVQIADLSGRTLGLTSDNLIKLDINAASVGWFIDLTPDSNSEFSLVGDQWIANEQSPAWGKVDLLTVLTHEYGHVLGLADQVTTDTQHDLLDAVLATGIRRLQTSLVVSDSDNQTPNAENAVFKVLASDYDLVMIVEHAD